MIGSDRSQRGPAWPLHAAVFVTPLDFKSFATTARDATEISASGSNVMLDMNIEFIHNNIHYWVGGDGGHTSQIPVATFHPTFWFHHCNLDRLFAIWQTLNPEKWFGADKTRPFDQKVIGMGDIVTHKTPFRPFHKNEEGALWDADAAADWFKLGYTYPELQPWLPDDDPKATLLRSISDTYAVSRKEVLEMGKLGGEPAGVVDVKDGSIVINDYAVSIKYSKFAMGGLPFNIELYLHPEEGPGNDFSPEEFLASVYNFSQPAEQNGETVCSNCSNLEEKDVPVTAYIPVTSYLLKMIQQKQLKNLDQINVEKVLKRIYYRVSMVGKTVPEEQWKPSLNLKVDVSVCKMEYPKDPDVSPIIDDPQVIPSLSFGRENDGKDGDGGNEGDSGNDSGDLTGPIPHNVDVNTIAAFQEAVSDGGSVVIKAPSIQLGPPPPGMRLTTTIMSLLWVKDGADLEDDETYDELLRMGIRNKGQPLLLCTSKEAGRGPVSLADLAPVPWFQGDNPVIRVDIRASDFVVHIDGREVGVVNRAIRGGNVTHVRYWTTGPRPQPLLGKAITVETYQQTSLVA